MKIPLLFLLFCVPAMGQESPIQVPVIATNGQFVAFWYNPPYIQRTNSSPYIQPIANLWIPEWSQDGVTWNVCGNQSATMPDRSTRAVGLACLSCLNWTETSAGAQVRIRLVPY